MSLRDLFSLSPCEVFGPELELETDSLPCNETDMERTVPNDYAPCLPSIYDRRVVRRTVEIDQREVQRSLHDCIQNARARLARLSCDHCGEPLTSDDYKLDRIENGKHTRCVDYWQGVADDESHESCSEQESE